MRRQWGPPLRWAKPRAAAGAGHISSRPIEAAEIELKAVARRLSCRRDSTVEQMSNGQQYGRPTGDGRWASANDVPTHQPAPIRSLLRLFIDFVCVCVCVSEPSLRGAPLEAARLVVSVELTHTHTQRVGLACQEGPLTAPQRRTQTNGYFSQRGPPPS